MQVKPIKIVILYLLFSMGWILFGDRLISILSLLFPAVKYEHLRMLKSIFFILCTAGLLYFAIKKQQKSLLNSEKQYKNLFLSNPMPMWICDVHTLSFLGVNNAAISAYGYSCEELKNMTVPDICKNLDHSKTLSFVNSIPNLAIEPVYWEYSRKNGDQITAQINCHKILFRKQEALLMMMRDVTVQLQQEEQLNFLYSTERKLKEELERNILLMECSLEEKQRLAEIIDRIYNIVIITSPAGEIIWVNQAFVKITGFTFEEAVGQTIAIIHGPKSDPLLQEKIRDAVMQNDFAFFEVCNYTKAGEEFWVEVSLSPIYNEENKVVRYIAIENIITERKLSDEKIKHQNEMLKTLAWTNSHAIRKPVTSIQGLANLSRDTLNLNELKEIHSLIAACAKELDDITKNVSKVIDEGV